MILPINAGKISNQSTLSPNFRANIRSPRLQFSNKDFFIRIRGYGRNKSWAESVKQTADTATILIRNKCGFDNLMRFITAGIIRANKLTKDEAKKFHTGILRTERESYRYGSDWDGHDLVTYYEKIPRYKIYYKKLNQTIEKPLKNPYPDIDLTIPIKDSSNYIKHGDSEKVNFGLDIIEELYYKLLSKYSPQKVTSKELKDITNSIAEIRWLMAHITPWERGSDAISNVFMRALFKTYGIKTTPSAKNISFDMEAYCTNLKEYQKKFPNFFEKAPKVIE